MKIKSVLAILVLFALAAVSLIAVPASAAACTVRTDWPTYRVKPGDNLGILATRYHVSSATLATANCINNPSLIYYGMLLHVPPGSGGSSTSTPSAPNNTLGVTFQQFEQGFMIWRSTTNDIWVYVGQNNGAVLLFLSHVYSGLPDNPISDPVPAGRIKPSFGFGKVWGNFPNVRPSLGWATGGETAYRMTYLPTSLTDFNFSLPDGRSAVTHDSTTWTVSVPATPTPQPGSTSVTTNAAFQLFENGFLIWRMDTARIEQFTKTDVAGYDLSQYASLPDNPITIQPPIGRVSPINGFGRVWGNFADTRNALGWGLGVEQGYTATFKTNLATSVICVNLPDRQFISYPHFIGNRSYSWQYEASCG